MSKRALLMAGIPTYSMRGFDRAQGKTPKLFMDGGGGGGGEIPDNTTQNVNTVPEFIRPYVETMLGKTQALTNDAQYQPFDPAQRFEGVNPMMQQSYDAMGNMQVAPQLGQATDAAGNAINIAGQAGINGQGLMNTALGMGFGGMQAGNQYGVDAQNPNTIAGFMSPYMQNVVDLQKQEAIRDYQNQIPGMQAAATQAGAFGGSRHAILEAEGQRNLNRNLADIQAKGTQSAYDQALQSMQFGTNAAMQGYQTGLQGVGQGINAAQLGLQGADTQLQGAQTLGQLGQTQFNQQMGIAEGLNTMGGQQQQQAQQIRDFDYQQYLDELNFPYKQLGFMSDMTRGLPLVQGSSTVYQRGPDSNAQLLGAGLAGLGIMNRAQGGMVKGYAAGGQVDGQAFDTMGMDETTAALQALDDQQLAQYAATVKDAVTLSLIRAEQQRRQNMRAPQGQMPQSTVAQDVAGLAGIQGQPDQPMMPQQGQPMMPQQGMAAGGIVALADGGGVPTPWYPFNSGPPARVPVQTPAPAPVRLNRGPSIDELIEARKRQGTGPIQIPEWLRGTLPSDMVDPRNPYAAQMDQAREALRAREAAAQQRAQGDPSAIRAGIPEENFPVSTGPEGSAMNETPPPPPAPKGPPGAGGSASAAYAASLGGSGGLQSSVPDANIPASFAEYQDALRSEYQQSQEEKDALDAMRAGIDERQARALAQEKRGNMDALIAAGTAMMQGRTMAEGIALGGAAGAKKLFEATDKRDKALEAVADAQDAQKRYELALLTDNKKTIGDAYKNYMTLQNAALDRTQAFDIAKAKLGLEAQRIQVARERNAMTGTMLTDFKMMKDIESELRGSPEGKALAKQLENPLAARASGADAQPAYDALRRRLYTNAGIGYMLDNPSMMPTAGASASGKVNLGSFE